MKSPKKTIFGFTVWEFVLIYMVAAPIGIYFGIYILQRYSVYVKDNLYVKKLNLRILCSEVFCVRFSDQPEHLKVDA